MNDTTERDHEMYRDSGFLRELADKVRNHHFVGGTGSYLRHHVTEKIDQHFGLTSQRECDARGKILNQIKEACGQGSWMACIDWAQMVVAHCRHADTVEGRVSDLQPEHCPAYIHQIEKERDHWRSMYETQGRMYDDADRAAKDAGNRLAELERQLLDAETAGYRVAMESMCIMNAITSHMPRTCCESVLYCPQLGKHFIDSTATLVRDYLNGSEGKEFTKLTTLLRKQMHLMYQQARYREADEISDAIGEPRPSDHERGDL